MPTAGRSSVTSPEPDPQASTEGGVVSRLGREWAEAGWGSRTVFVIAVLYWLATLALFLATLPAVRNGYELWLIVGFYFVPLLYALILRAAYVFVRRGPRRPAIVSWWVLVIGALLSILVTVARTTAPAS